MEQQNSVELLDEARAHEFSAAVASPGADGALSKESNGAKASSDTKASNGAEGSKGARVKTPARNQNAGFDRVYFLLGAFLIGSLLFAVRIDSPDLELLTLLTNSLWLSVGMVMLISRFNKGRWE